jgi:hypothetical protein
VRIETEIENLLRIEAVSQHPVDEGRGDTPGRSRDGATEPSTAELEECCGLCGGAARFEVRAQTLPHFLEGALMVAGIHLHGAVEQRCPDVPVLLRLTVEPVEEPGAGAGPLRGAGLEELAPPAAVREQPGVMACQEVIDDAFVRMCAPEANPFVPSRLHEQELRLEGQEGIVERAALGAIALRERPRGKDPELEAKWVGRGGRKHMADRG